MRLASIFLVIVFTFGCGADPVNKSQGPHFGTAFTPPSLTTLQPSTVPVNSAPFTMTVNGTNFRTDALVVWNGVTQHTIFVNSNQLLVTVTDVDLMFAGLAHVFVRTAGLNSNTLDFDVAPQ
jgi:hypothetical protein